MFCTLSLRSLYPVVQLQKPCAVFSSTQTCQPRTGSCLRHNVLSLHFTGYSKFQKGSFITFVLLFSLIFSIAPCFVVASFYHLFSSKMNTKLNLLTKERNDLSLHYVNKKFFIEVKTMFCLHLVEMQGSPVTYRRC